MDIILYLLISSVEWLALIILTFSMFKFQLKGYWGQIVFTAAILSLVSHLIFNTLQLQVLSTFVQPPIVFLFFWQMFRVHVFYAGLMTVYGYTGYIFIQHIVILSFRWAGANFENIFPGSLLMFLLQLLTSLIAVLVSFIIYRSRIGYSFVPDYELVPFSLKGLNLHLLLLILLGYVFLSLSNFVTITSPSSMLLFVMIMCVVLGILLYFAQRKEVSDD